MQQQASGVAGPFACYLFCMVKHEALPMCVQGRVVFWLGNAMVKDVPVEMIPAVHFEHCVQMLSEHLKTSCNFDLSL